MATKMPRYQCHKVVHALKLADVIVGEGPTMLVPASPEFERFEAPDGWIDRFDAAQFDPGYYVVYADGFASWSPTQAFEDGYTQLPPSECAG